jgi:hypothetical protein
MSANEIATLLEPLTHKQRLFCEAKLRGATDVQAAREAGYADPRKEACKIAKMPGIKEALQGVRAISARELGRTREQLDEMLMQAWTSAANAMEQVAVVRELGKLHGLYAPTKHEHKVDTKVEHVAQLANLSTDDLRKLAAGDLSMLPSPDVLEGEFEEVPRAVDE